MSKASKKSRVVVLRLAAADLSQFPAGDSHAAATDASKKPNPSPRVQLPDAGENGSDSNATPVPGNDAIDNSLLAPPDADGKKKKGGPMAGRKRAPPSIDPNAPPKERSKPGPKKKARLDAIDRAVEKKGAALGANAGLSKLGPKGHMGPINAGLRNLDRSGKPCRRWERKGLVLKTFTGLTWDMSTWKAPPRESANEEGKSDSPGSSDIKLTQASSVVASEKSHNGDSRMDVTMTELESSPAPAIAV